MWCQKSIQLHPARRGFHLVTEQIQRAFPELDSFETGLLHIFIQHTSASISINENADPDVPVDLERAFNHAAPENLPYIHTLEGPDDMPAHVKCSMIGSSATVPISRGRLMLGTWQGIYLCEHRNRASGRHLVLTAWGEPRST